MTSVNEAPIADTWGIPRPNPKCDLPSGMTVTYRKMSIPTMIELGILDKLDSFAPKVLETATKKKKKGEAEDKLDPKQLLDVMTVMDQIFVSCVVSPKVYADPEEGEDIVEGRRYVAEIPIEDKTKILEVAMEGLEEFFRLGGEQAASVGSVETVQGV